MNEKIQGLTDIALDPHTILSALAIFILIRVIGKTPVGKHPLYRRLLPVLPETMGVAISFIGGIPVVEDQPVVIRIAVGLWCGYLSQRAHKIIGQTLLGDDPKIAERAIAKSSTCHYCGGDRFGNGRCITCGAAVVGSRPDQIASPKGEEEDTREG